ncbi:DUF6220 domain-containing protein [Sulfitobacter pontiacus]|uniref:DUF6220 domain-containing protein n=1 Tax=Sulfitobacter pontiacus TaxID=60137 RepID=UPI0027721309|nr:DUF6220 domain-containing protein [Sulfitobacter pontiacus]GLO79881.1 hypothetical protein MACH23_33020 [Sulfitobacter pontiacus]
MISPTRTAPVASGRGTPAFFTAAAWTLPAAIGAQFALAGQALFNGLSWTLHGTVGALVALPILALFCAAFLIRQLRGFRWWAGLLLGLYVLQITLAAFGPAALALHPFNAALLLSASLIVLAKVEKRRRKTMRPSGI